VRCNSIHFLCNIWEKIVFPVMDNLIKVFQKIDPGV
jgi:hypothetical protein